MAETFGVVAGALSVAALFTTCVTCFEYVQLGRSFGQDYDRCRVKVDIAQLRLSRWGEAVAIRTDSRFAADSPADEHTRQVQSILEQIKLLFQEVQQTSERYVRNVQGAKPEEDLAVYKDEDLQPSTQQLHKRIAQVVRQRQDKTSLVVRQRQDKTSFLKKVAWALYDGKQFDRLLSQITGFLDSLEKFWPVEEAAAKELVQLEIQGVDDKQALRAIHADAADIDSILANAAEHKANGIAGQNLTGNISQQDTARVRVGHEFSDQNTDLFKTITDQTTNKTGTIDARGNSRLHVGSSYGGRSIFDD